MKIDFPSHFGQIKNLLSDYLIEPEGGLDAVYQELHAYSSGLPSNIPYGKVWNFRAPYQTFLKSTGPELTTLAVDLPAFFKSPSGVQETLMVCAMDSLPPLPESTFWEGRGCKQGEDVGLWVPFSLIDDWDTPGGSLRSNAAFFRELLSRYNLYITDIFKVFFRIGSAGRYVVSNQIPEYTGLAHSHHPNVHAHILAEEIKVMDPVGIVTLGNNARNALIGVNERNHGHHQTVRGWGNDLQSYRWAGKVPVIALPHISGAANGAKSSILNNPKYSGIEANFQNQKLAKIVLSNL
jgi:hypothetical protein